MYDGTETSNTGSNGNLFIVSANIVLKVERQ
jgi:hypothetical protein